MKDALLSIWRKTFTSCVSMQKSAEALKQISIYGLLVLVVLTSSVLHATCPCSKSCHNNVTSPSTVRSGSSAVSSCHRMTAQHVKKTCHDLSTSQTHTETTSQSPCSSCATVTRATCNTPPDTAILPTPSVTPHLGLDFLPMATLTRADWERTRVKNGTLTRLSLAEHSTLLAALLADVPLYTRNQTLLI